MTSCLAAMDFFHPMIIFQRYCLRLNNAQPSVDHKTFKSSTTLINKLKYELEYTFVRVLGILLIVFHCTFQKDGCILLVNSYLLLQTSGAGTIHSVSWGSWVRT